MKTSLIRNATIGFAAAVLAAPMTGLPDTHDTEIVIVNLTDGDLILVRKFDDSHTHWENDPQNLITNTGTMKCKHYTKALFYGCDGGVTYRLAAGGEVSVRVRNTFASGNHFYSSIMGVQPKPNPDGKGVANLHVNAYGPAHGNDIGVTFIISWADLDQQINNVNWNQVNDNLNKNWQMLKASETGK